MTTQADPTIEATPAAPVPALFDLSPESVIVYDSAGVVRYWNPASQDLYGWPATTTIGHNLDPLARAGWLPLADLLREGRFKGRQGRRTIYGSDIEAEVTIAVSRDARGKAIEIIEFGRRSAAISHAPTSQEADAPCQGRFERLLDHMPIALWEIDARAAGQNFDRLRREGVKDLAAFLDTRPDIVDFTCDTVLISRVNRAAISLFGAANAEDLLGPIRYIYSESPGTANRIMVAHWNGQRHHVEEMKVRTCDGRILDVMFLATFLKLSEDIATTFLMLIDISDRTRAEANLVTMQADFVHAVRISTLGELVSSIGRELKVPLAAAEAGGRAIVGALDTGPADPEAIRREIGAVMARALEANAIISRVGAMAVKSAPRSEMVDMLAVIGAARHVVDHICRERRITIVEQLAPDLPLVIGDPMQLQQVMVNLLMNAIHALETACAAQQIILVAFAD